MQVQRLERIFSMLDESPKGQKCKGMAGLIEEGEEIMDEGADAPPAVCDAALIGSAQRIEHYEISGYGTARTYAQRLGLDDQADILEETLQEERATDKKLTQIAESYINEEARSAR
jgi:ferritin-like metal-binding protein YciE